MHLLRNLLSHDSAQNIDFSWSSCKIMWYGRASSKHWPLMKGGQRTNCCVLQALDASDLGSPMLSTEGKPSTSKADNLAPHTTLITNTQIACLPATRLRNCAKQPSLILDNQINLPLALLISMIYHKIDELTIGAGIKLTASTTSTFCVYLWINYHLRNQGSCFLMKNLPGDWLMLFLCTQQFIHCLLRMQTPCWRMVEQRRLFLH